MLHVRHCSRHWDAQLSLHVSREMDTRHVPIQSISRKMLMAKKEITAKEGQRAGGSGAMVALEVS